MRPFARRITEIRPFTRHLGHPSLIVLTAIVIVSRFADRQLTFLLRILEAKQCETVIA